MILLAPCGNEPAAGRPFRRFHAHAKPWAWHPAIGSTCWWFSRLYRRVEELAFAEEIRVMRFHGDERHDAVIRTSLHYERATVLTFNRKCGLGSIRQGL